MNNIAILHVDMNNFYASVECISKPELKNVPMAVAGDPAKRHGIILAKNQLAKEKGVATGEPIWQAERKCPNLVLVEPHYEKYEYFSKKAFEIYSRYTNQVESYGLDECWLDVSGSQLLFGTGKEIGKKIMNDIKNELGLTVSVGVSFNKIFAKLGSDMKKPDALTEISESNFKNLIWNLPASDLLFVGKSTNKQLQKFGIETIGELAQTPKSLLKQTLGKIGEQIWEYANGLDKSKVADCDFRRELKSIGNSTTTAQDLHSAQEVKKVLYTLSEKVAHRLRKHQLYANSLHLTIRTDNLEHYQKSVSLENSVADSQMIFEETYKMYKSCKETRAIRSLGIRAEKLSTECVEQCSFFNEVSDDKAMKLEEIKDKLRAKYGVASVQRALLIEKNTAKSDADEASK